MTAIVSMNPGGFPWVDEAFRAWVHSFSRRDEGPVDVLIAVDDAKLNEAVQCVKDLACGFVEMSDERALEVLALSLSYWKVDRIPPSETIKRALLACRRFDERIVCPSPSN